MISAASGELSRILRATTALFILTLIFPPWLEFCCSMLSALTK